MNGGHINQILIISIESYKFLQEYDLIVKATFIDLVPEAWIQLWISIASAIPPLRFCKASEAPHRLHSGQGGLESSLIFTLKGTCSLRFGSCQAS